MISIPISVKGRTIEALSLDAGAMLSAEIDNIHKAGYTSVCFDIKRADGTIGYDSALASVDMYGAQSSTAGDLGGSIKKLTENDVLPVGRVSCYKDNVLAMADSETVIQGFENETYVNPNSDTVYNYIKGIVEEVSSMGVTVFILENCDLPQEISDSYNDGFNALSERLYADLGNNVRFIQSVSVSIGADNTKSAEMEWAEKTQGVSESDVIFYITAKEKDMVKDLLDSKSNINYIILE